MKRVLLLIGILILVALVGIVIHRRSTNTETSLVGATNTPGESSTLATSAVVISTRGPGMKQMPPNALALRNPRTLDLTHVDPANFADALGKNPVRIFNYVRDEIAYESYSGCLRGPRGTLMSMAGNSVDRAALLASMLQHAGQRVRFAKGTLPEAQATELVSSMWAERPELASTQGEPSSAIKAASDELSTSVGRDYTLIRGLIKDANLNTSQGSAPSFDSLVKETQDHYWVQWFKDGAWVDLDPSFSDSAPGKQYANAQQTMDALPEDVFHQVEILVRLEEYTGNQVSNRVILTHKSNAADLSGSDIVLTHQPENWQGPAESLQSALSSAIAATGRVKPVLLIGGSVVAGQPFYQKGPPTTGMGGIFSQLSGAGTRHAVPLATQESIEFDFTAPGGAETKVVRELFDVIGPARRSGGKDLTADEVEAKIHANPNDVSETVYDLFLTTGRLDRSLLPRVGDASAESVDDAITALHRVNAAFTIIADGLLQRLSTSDKQSVIFYPDTPRLQVAELSDVAGKVRLSLDLRWDHVRAATLAMNSEDGFFAQTFRGVVDGALERVLIDYLTSGNPAFEDRASRLSTSLLFERRQSEGVKAVLQSHEDPSFGEGISEDTRARVNDEFTHGFVVVAPERPIALAGQPRFAWWRIDPRSGEVTAVTDEGLNQVEYKAVVSRSVRGTIYGVRLIRILPGLTGGWLFTGYTQPQFLELIADLIKLGAKVTTNWQP